MNAELMPTWLYHVTLYRRLSRISEEGLRPGNDHFIRPGMFERDGWIFLSELDGVGYWAEKAEEWAAYAHEDILEDEAVPVVLRVRAIDALPCEPDGPGTEHAKYDAFRCRGVAPGDLQVWVGNEEAGRWAPVAEYGDIDLASAFEVTSEFDAEFQEIVDLELLRHAFPSPLIGDYDVLEPDTERNPAASRAKVLAW